jgi:RNA polymerase sigma-70 factor (ECF subfamily)
MPPLVSHEAIEAVFREEYGRILAGLVRALGDFDRAEDSLQEAFEAAVSRWPAQGLPDNPAAWLATTARNRAIDTLRRQKVYQSKLEAIATEAPSEETEVPPGDDDLMALIFTCCHPALSEEAQIALTLRSVGGLTTKEIASALLVPEPTMAQRLVRVKRRIKDEGIAFKLPPPELWSKRVDAVLLVIYLIFNEGYSSSSGDDLTRPDLCSEAIHLADTLAKLLPQEPEVRGLAALLLLQDSRRSARTDEHGDLVTLEDQDRSLWDEGKVDRGLAHLEAARGLGERGAYQLQAEIAAHHAIAAAAELTNWRAIAAAYDELMALQPSPVVALNRAVAMAMAYGPEAGLGLIAELDESPELARYHHLQAARADLLRRAGRFAEARDAYRKAISMCANPVERRYLTRRLAEVTGAL